MKHSLLQTAVFASIIGMTSIASADNFYIDSQPNGVATLTSPFEQMSTTYESTTTFTDANSDGILSAGDTFIGTGGLLNNMASGPGNVNNTTNDITHNLISGFIPGIGANTQGYLTDWGLAFGWNDLSGKINSSLEAVYTGGTINLYYFDATDIANGTLAAGDGQVVMQVEISTGARNFLGQSLDIDGTISFAEADMFFFEKDDREFNDLIANLVDIEFLSTQTTSPFFVNGTEVTSGMSDAQVLAIMGGMFWHDTDNDGVVDTYTGEGYLAGEHEGDFKFVVPEPTSIALLGLGLLGFAGYKKRK